MKLFSENNPFFEFMANVGDYVMLNLAFIISALPVFTLGAAYTASFEAVRKHSEGNAYIIKAYFKALKENFLKCTLIWTCMLISGGVLIYDIKFGAVPVLLKVIFVCMFVLILHVGAFIFLLQSIYKNSIKNIFILRKLK